MRNAQRLWCISAVSITAALALYLARPFGSTVAKDADIDQRLPAPLLDETRKGVWHGNTHHRRRVFWGVQGVFQHVRGVVNAMSGYAQYQVVSTGTTGHAESVRIT